MINFLRQSKIAAGFITILRIYIGWEWINAALSKLTSGEFQSDGVIQSALTQGNNGQTFAYPWFLDFLHLTTNGGENTAFFNFLIPWGELFVGLGLIFGTFTLAAAFFGLIMNFTFLLSGIVSTNPTFILLQMLLLIAGANSGRIGLDRWLTPWWRSWLPFLKNDITFKKVV